MRARKTRTRAIAYLLLALFMLPFIALGETTQIRAVIPNAHTFTVTCGEGGGVRVNGEVLYGTTRFSVTRFHDFTFTCVPDEGYGLKEITCTAARGVTISGDTATLANARANAAFTVTFELKSVIELGEEGAKLYDEYLGEDSGVGDLFILYDKDYAPDDYQMAVEVHTDEEILNALPQGLAPAEREEALALIREAYPNAAIVIAQPERTDAGGGEYQTVTDENGAPVYGHRNLLISGGQIEKLKDQSLTALTLKNSDFDVTVDLRELKEDRLLKLIVLMNEAGETFSGQANADELDRMPNVTTWENAKNPRLTREMYDNTLLEIRVTPIRADAADADTADAEALTAREIRDLTEQGFLTDAEAKELNALTPLSRAYRARVYLVSGGAEAEISGLLNTLRVSVGAGALLDSEIEHLKNNGYAQTADETLDALARERLLSYTAIAMINANTPVTEETYTPGMFTSILPAFIQESAATILKNALAEEYDVHVEKSGRAAAYLAIVKYIESLPLDQQDPRLAADSESGGLYLAVRASA